MPNRADLPHFSGASVLAGCAVILCLLSGCMISRQPTASQPTNFSFFVRESAHHLQRIAIMPLYRGSEVGNSASSFDASLATALREVGLFEVVSITPQQRDALLGPRYQSISRLSIDQIRKARQSLHVNGILIGYIDHFDSYDPISSGIEFHLLDCRSGETVWSVTAHHDGRRHDVQSDIELWHRDTVGRGRPQGGGWQHTLQSPTLFCRYVSDRVSESILWTEAERFHQPDNPPRL